MKRLSNALSYANNRIRQLENQLETYKKEEESKIEEISAIVEKLNKEHQEEVNKLNAKIKQLEARLNIDSTNSSWFYFFYPIGPKRDVFFLIC